MMDFKIRLFQKLTRQLVSVELGSGENDSAVNHL